jgi:hypothetical protein
MYFVWRNIAYRKERSKMTVFMGEFNLGLFSCSIYVYVLLSMFHNETIYLIQCSLVFVLYLIMLFAMVIKIIFHSTHDQPFVSIK